MAISEYLAMSYKEPESKLKLQKVLTKTKWLEKYGDKPQEITLDKLQHLYNLLSHKYTASIAYIQPAGDDSMCCMIKNSETHQWIETIYFISFYECLAKVILVFYGYFIKKLNFKDVGRVVVED